MSSEERQQSEAYLDALWRGYCDAIAHARNLKSQAVAQYATGYVESVTAAGGDEAKVAKDSGLVSDLKTEQEVEQRLIGLVGADPSGKSYRQVSVSDYLRATHAEDKLRGKGAAVGVIIASGEMLGKDQPVILQLLQRPLLLDVEVSHGRYGGVQVHLLRDRTVRPRCLG